MIRGREAKKKGEQALVAGFSGHQWKFRALILAGNLVLFLNLSLQSKLPVRATAPQVKERDETSGPYTHKTQKHHLHNTTSRKMFNKKAVPAVSTPPPHTGFLFHKYFWFFNCFYLSNKFLIMLWFDRRRPTREPSACGVMCTTGPRLADPASRRG